METFGNGENQVPINNTSNLSEILDDETKKLNLLTRAAFKETTLEEEGLVQEIIETSSLDNILYQRLLTQSENFDSFDEYQKHHNFEQKKSWEIFQEKIQSSNRENWFTLDFLKYAHREPLDKEVNDAIELEIEKGNIELMKEILEIRKLKVLNKFNSAEEQWNWLTEKETEFLKRFNEAE